MAAKKYKHKRLNIGFSPRDWSDQKKAAEKDGFGQWTTWARHHLLKVAKKLLTPT